MSDIETFRSQLSAEENRDLDIEINFLKGLVNRDYEYIEALQLLGDDYTKRGKFRDGLKIDEQLAKLLPEDSMVFYNLACSYSLTNAINESIVALNKAVILGYSDSEWMDRDPDLNNVKSDNRYNSIRQKLIDNQIN
jgi:tetratricopeptide (TPR) repeat protein